MELRRLRHRGWRLVNHFAIRPWDIDHVLVGPGGVFAVKTKWSRQPWTVDPAQARIQSAVGQVRRNAEDLRRWADLRRAGVVQVQPLVVLWGPSTPDADGTTAIRQVDGVWVVPGPALRQWTEDLPSTGLDPETVRAAWHVLDHQVRRRDRYEDERPGMSFSALAVQVAATACAAALGALAGYRVLASSWPSAIKIAIVLGLIAAGVPARRVRSVRYPLLGWQAGAAGALLTALAAYLVVVLIP